MTARRWLRGAGLLSGLLALCLSAADARADFDAGLAAYRAGDHVRALREFRAVGDAGNPAAQNNVGLMLLRGEGAPADAAAAARWFRRAADAGHAGAMVNLGDLHLDGDGVARDDAAAIALYRRAAGLGAPAGLYSLGWMIERGRGAPQSDAEAAALYRQAADKGHAGAQRALGLLHELGRGVAKDEARAVDLYRQAAASGLADGQFALGFMLMHGRGTPRDAAAAVDWWRKAAARGHRRAMARLGLALLDGEGVGADPKEAVTWLERAAERGEPEALFGLGMAHAEGRGVAKDVASAATLYRRAADAGHVAAKRELAALLRAGEVIAADAAEARRLLTDAAERDDARAQVALAAMLTEAEGGPRDLAGAMTWLERASKQGHEPADEAIEALLRGVVPGADAATIRGWLETAAARGHRAARLRLGLFLEAGIGGPVDRDGARRWLTAVVDEPPSGSVDARRTALEMADMALLALARMERPEVRQLAAGPATAPPATRAPPARLVLVGLPKPAGEGSDLEPRFALRDPAGAVAFAGPLPAGTELPLPDGTWLLTQIDSSSLSSMLPRIGLRVDGRPVTPRLERGQIALRLDADALASGASPGLDPAALRDAFHWDGRVTVKALKSGALDFRDAESRATLPGVPIQAGAVLPTPAWPAVWARLHPGIAVEIAVDGQPTLTLEAPPFREIELRLDPAALTGARVLPPDARKRASPRRDDPRPAPFEHVTAADGRVIGWLGVPHPGWIEEGPRHVDSIAAIFTQLAAVMRRDTEARLRHEQFDYQVALRRGGPDSAIALKALRSLADAHARNAETGRALDLYDRVRVGLARLPDGIVAEEADVLIAMSELYEADGQLRLAERFARQALGAIERRFGGERDLDLALPADTVIGSGTTPEHRAKARLSTIVQGYGQLADVLVGLGDSARAEWYLMRQIQLEDLVDTEFGSRRGARLLLSLERVLRGQGRQAAADAALRRAHRSALLDLLRDHPAEPLRHPVDLSWTEMVGGPTAYSRMNAGALGLLREAYERLGRWPEAEPLAERELGIWRNVHGAGSVEVARAESRLARIRWRLGRLSAALEGSRRALGPLLRQPPVPAEPALLHLDLLDAAGAARLEPAPALIDEGFRLIQQARVSDTAGAVAQMAARFASGSDDLARAVRAQQDVAAQKRARDAALARALAEPVAARDLKAEAALRDEIASLAGTLDRLTAGLAQRFPRYIDLVSPRPLATREVRAALWPNEALAAWHVGENHSYLFVLRRDRSQMIRLDVGARGLEAAVRGLRETLDPARLAEIDPARFARLEPLPFDAAAAHRLYEAILKPAEPALAGIDHLFVVPDGALHQLPFQLLPTRPPQRSGDTAADYRAIDWLFRSRAVTTLPTASALASLRVFAGAAPAPEPLLGFGDPALEGTPGSTRGRRLVLVRGGQVDVTELRRLEPLPDSADELRALARALDAPDSMVRLGRDASEARLRQEDLSRARILAFATHGLVSGELGGLREPALVMTPPSVVERDEDDGLLTASEIARGLTLNADLVILSACNTAAGDGSENAEGLSGLAKAFFYAGSRSLLVSHWSIPSAAAVKLTTETFRALAADRAIGRAEGLRRSMAALLEDREPSFAHPMFWAPFVIAGEGGRGAPPADLALPAD